MTAHTTLSLRFTTASGSLYLLERTSAGTTLTRLPQESEPGPELEGYPGPLRRDAEPITVLRIVHCELGMNGIFVLDLRGDGVATVRTTSPIREIVHLTGAPTHGASNG